MAFLEQVAIFLAAAVVVVPLARRAGLGGGQVALTAAVLAALALVLGLPLESAVVAGLALALSSTAFALQALAERNELTARHGRLPFTYRGDKPQSGIGIAVWAGGEYQYPLDPGSGALRYTDYEGSWAPFVIGGGERKDLTRALSVDVHNRALTLAGFSPQLSAVKEERTSNAQLHDYERLSGELRFVRLF